MRMKLCCALTSALIALFAAGPVQARVAKTEDYANRDTGSVVQIGRAHV